MKFRRFKQPLIIVPGEQAAGGTRSKIISLLFCFNLQVLLASFAGGQVFVCAEPTKVTPPPYYYRKEARSCSGLS